MRYCETGHHSNDGKTYDNDGLDACFRCAVEAGAIDEDERYLDESGRPLDEPLPGE